MRSVLDELRSLDTRPDVLRRFGLSVGAVLSAIVVVVAWWGGTGDFLERFADLPSRIRESSGLTATLIAGVALVTFGLLIPASLRRPYLAWMGIALALGFVMTRAILTVVFFGIVTPIGLVRRAFGHDPMRRTPDPTVETYWIRREPPADVRSSLEKYW